MYGEYAAGAMDASEWQRKHDIDKACEWFKGFLQEIGYEITNITRRFNLKMF